MDTNSVKNKVSFLLSTLLFSQLTFISYSHAAPTGGQVVGGNGTISQSNTTTTIQQNTNLMAIDWQSYNVNQNERVHYIQPGSSSISLNRILGSNASTIRGQIDANGQVILVNPNGIFFTPTATINVGGIMASGLDIKPTDFMNGNYIFNEVLGTNGTVINSGIINAATGGSVTLLGKQVKNDGVIVAKLGMVTMAAGKAAVVTFDNAGLIGIKVTKAVLQNELGIDPAVLNSGTINAKGGKILLTASVSKDIFSSAVNTGSMQQATSVVVHPDGTFTLGGGSDVVNTGTLDVSTNVVNQNAGNIIAVGNNVTSSGVIKADAQNGNGGSIELHATDTTKLTKNSITSAVAKQTGNGGTIKVLGNKVGLFDSASVDVSGANGGGTALIGGDKTGHNKAIRNAKFIYLGDNTSVKADATDNGNGGKLITFASNTARIYGNLSARGGASGGNGGFIETSGLQGFEITKAPDISAPMGIGGEWLIDPYNIFIVDCFLIACTTTGTGNIDAAFTATGVSAQLDVNLVYDALDGSTNGNIGNCTGAGCGTGGNNQNGGSGKNTVTISTGTTPTGGVPEAGIIKFNTNFDYRGASGSTLILNAASDINTNGKKILADKSKGSLNIEFNAGADVLIKNSLIRTNGGNFTATGVNFTSTDTTQGNRDIKTKGGNVKLTMTGNVKLGSNITTKGGNVSITQTSLTATDGVTTGFTDTTTVPTNPTIHTAIIDTTGGNNGTVTINATGAVKLGADILTDGQKVDIASSGSFTNGYIDATNVFRGIIDTTGKTTSTGAVSINSTGIVKLGSDILTRGNTVTIARSSSFTNRYTDAAAPTKVFVGKIDTTKGTAGNGIVTLNSTGLIDVNALIRTEGSDINIASSGSFTLNSKGSLTTTGRGSRGGNIAINSVGTVTINNAITTNNGSVKIGSTTTRAGSFISNANGVITTTGNNGILDIVTSGTITAVGELVTSGAATIDNNGTGAKITLDNLNNDFQTTVTLNNLDGAVSIQSSKGIQFATSNVGTGTLTATASGITQTGAITQTTGAGIAQFNGGNGIIDLQQANDFTGVVQLNTAAGNNNVFIIDKNTIELGTSTIGGTLTVTAGVDIKQTNTGTNGIDVGGLALFKVNKGRSIFLEDTSNKFTQISFEAIPDAQGVKTLQDVTFANSIGLDLQSLNLTGNLTVTANGVIKSTAGSMTVLGDTILTASNVAGTSAFDITLDQGTNDFINLVIKKANTVTITDTNGINIGNDAGLLSTINGNLTLTTTGNITQTAALTMTPTSTATFKAGVGSIDLSQNEKTGQAIKNNDFNDIVLQAGGTVDVADKNTINIAGATIGGNFTVKADGNIKQTVAIKMAAGTTADFASTNGTINLVTAGNDFNILKLASSKAVNIRDESTTGITLDATTITGTGTLTVTTTQGDIKDTAGQKITLTGGLLTLDAGTSNNILLNQNNHAFNTVAFIGNDVKLNTAAGLNLVDSATNPSSTNGILNITTNGTITDSNSTGIVVNGTASLNAGSGNVDMTKTDFSGAVSATATNSITIVDANSLALGTMSTGTKAGTTIALTAAGAITGGGSLTSNRVQLLASTEITANTTTALLSVESTTAQGNVTINNSGVVEIQKLKNTGNITFNNTGNVNINSGSIDGGYNATGTKLFMTLTNGSFLGVGDQDLTQADITAYNATLFARDGNFGTLNRPLVLSINQDLLISTKQSFRPVFIPRAPINFTDTSIFQFNFTDLVSTGEQLIEVEELEDIDPAIFSDVRNYIYGQIAIRLPKDQLFEDELIESDGEK